MKNNEPFINTLPVEQIPRAEKFTISLGNVNEDKKYFDKEYIEKCLSEVTDHIKRVYCTFLFRTGIRVTESLQLRKRDFDFKNQMLQIRWLKNRKYKYRIIPLHHSLISLMQLYVANMNQDELVFPWGRQHSYNVTQEIFGSGPHKLRHSFAVNWLRSGLDIYILSKVMGHSSVRVTEKEYLDIVPVDQGRELQKVIF